MKKILIIIIVVFLIMFVLRNIFFVEKNFNKAISEDVVTAKQINELLNDFIKNTFPFNEYNLTVGYIDMTLTNEHRGIVHVTMVEKNSVNPRIVLIELDTNEHLIYSVVDHGRESKLNPGEIQLNKWSIDSNEAVMIAEQMCTELEFFRYDEAWIKTCSYYNDTKETWDVFLTDKQNKKRCVVRIDPYSGDVLQQNIYDF